MMLLRRFLLCAFISIPLAAGAQDAARTPDTIMSELTDRLYVIGEQTGNAKEMAEAVESARAELEAMMASEDQALITSKNARGLTPLAVAAENGFAELVNQLLTSDAVRASVNDRDQDGFTPWISANFAFAEAGWVCSPSAFDDPQRWVPTFVKQPYYKTEPESAYRKTRRLLEEAGAVADHKAAIALYLSFCRNTTPEAKARIEATGDLLVAVEAEGTAMMDAYARKATGQAQ